MSNSNGTGKQRPVFIPENIPDALRRVDRWGPWWMGTKAPVLPSDAPDLWSDFEAALKTLNAQRHGGLGLCMTGLDGLVVVDLDGCFPGGAESDELSPWAAHTVAMLPETYTERSPSGYGLRMAYRLPAGIKITDRAAKIPGEAKVNNKWPGYDIFGGRAGGQHVTFTGDVWGKWAAWPEGAEVAEMDDVGLWAMDELFPKEIGVKEGEGALGGTGGAGTGEGAEIPEPLEEWELPDWRVSGISAKSMAFLGAGEDAGDGSATMAGVARDLVAVGWTDQEVLSILCCNEHARVVTSRHRRDDDAVIEYLWKHHVRKGRERAVMVATADDFDDLSGEDGALLRDLQRAENQRIRDEPTVIDTAGFVGPDQARERFVYLTMHNAVFDRLHPRAILKMEGFRNTFAASKIRVGQGRPRPVTDVWLEDRRRFTTETVTFRPGAGEITRCPLNNAAMNTWVPPSREGNVMDIQPFLDHIDYLFLDRAGDFLDWLAHIEQFPGELPHKCWLHISPSTGTGRNWLASVLCRVWPGFVAPNMELSGLIGGGFNGVLSECLLTIIDEIREGGSNTNQWANAEKFKQAINPEYRQINRKYGIQNMEWNCARWLIFSNHTQALPIDDDDRRVEVVINDEGPKDAAYYTRLYTLLNDPAFILGVAKFLGARDISKFNPGARARKTADKARVVAATKSDTQCKVEDLISSWPCDVITAGALASELGGDLRGLIPVLHRAGCESAVARPRMGADGKTQRIWVLRNVSRWRNAEGIELRQTIEKAGAEDF